MTIKQSAKNFNRVVMYNGKEYMLSAVRVRMSDEQYEYFAELSDLRANSIIVVKLSEVKEVIKNE